MTYRRGPARRTGWHRARVELPEARIDGRTNVEGDDKLLLAPESEATQHVFDYMGTALFRTTETTVELCAEVTAEAMAAIGGGGGG
jgi:hypothetical protein